MVIELDAPSYAQEIAVAFDKNNRLELTVQFCSTKNHINSENTGSKRNMTAKRESTNGVDACGIHTRPNTDISRKTGVPFFGLDRTLFAQEVWLGQYLYRRNTLKK